MPSPHPSPADPHPLTNGWNGKLTRRDRRCRRLKECGCYFYDTPVEEVDGPWVVVNGRRLLMLASYNYHGFMLDPNVRQAAHAALDRFGIGQHGVRMTSGTTTEHKLLESELAQFVHAEDAVVFSSGYVTNLATVAALIDQEEYVIGDELNHASIHDGCRFSGGDFRLFRHNDLDHLERLLEDKNGRNTLVVVDSVYSMEGDIAPVDRIAELCRRYEAWLMVDEAHSIGTLGATGRGVQEHFGLAPDAIHVKMGTLSKALGVLGGFVAGSKELVSYLRHHARGYIFSAALPAPQVAGAREALRLLQARPEAAVKLRQLTSRYVDSLRTQGFTLYGSDTQIVPIACPTEEITFQFARRCRELGAYVVPIVYPAVPLNAPRARTNLTLLHSEETVDQAVGILTEAAYDVGLLQGGSNVTV